MSAEPRTLSVRELLSSDVSGGEHWVTGRVALLAPSRLQLEHDGAAVWAACSDASAPIGAWVRVRGRLQSGVLIASALELVQEPARDPAHASSDAAWGRAGGVAALRARHLALRALRAYFEAEGFIEVETPAVVPSPGLELHLAALEVSGAGPRAYLHTSPEYQMKRLLVAGMSRIFQLGKAFRQGEVGARHQPEFTMLEWYRAFSGADAMMRDTEALAASVARALTGGTAIPGVEAPVDLAPPWERLTVRQAFERYAGVRVEQLLPDEDAFFRVLVEQVEPKLGRGKPTFLTEYPASMAALARASPHDSSVAERFEAYVDGIELCNGFGELTDPHEQRRRLSADQAARRALGKPVYPLDERFLAALEDGMPPSGGNALGVDRLLMLVLGKRSIDEVVAFSDARI